MRCRAGRRRCSGAAAEHVQLARSSLPLAAGAGVVGSEEALVTMFEVRRADSLKRPLGGCLLVACRLQLCCAAHCCCPARLGTNCCCPLLCCAGVHPAAAVAAGGEGAAGRSRQRKRHRRSAAGAAARGADSSCDPHRRSGRRAGVAVAQAQRADFRGRLAAAPPSAQACILVTSPAPHSPFFYTPD